MLRVSTSEAIDRMPISVQPGPADAGRRHFLTLCAGAAVAGATMGLPARPAMALAAPRALDPRRPPTSYPALFRTREIALGHPLRLLPKAKTLLGALAPAGRHGNAVLEPWEQLLADLARHDAVTQLVEVNRFVNGVAYVEDSRNWGERDRWATPAEFFAQGGDCEDFALVKFVSLHRLGFNRERLRMVLANDQRRGAAHAVLVVYLGDQAYVLDNQIATVTPHHAITHYRPLCSFNDHRLWVHRS